MGKLLPTSFIAFFISLFLFFTIFQWKTNFDRSIRPVGEYYPRSSGPPKTHLPGILDLRSRSLAVLGWDTEEISQDDFVKLVNRERSKVNSSPLAINQKLTQAALLRVDTIFKHQNFSHQDDFDHVQLDTVLPRVHYLFSYASENIGLAQDTATGIVNGFMSSPSHRQNLLDKSLIETGVGIKKGQFKGNFVVIVVQLFAIPISEEKYLGYSQADITTVTSLLSGVGEELAKTENLLRANPGSTYYRGWVSLLLKQKDRLTEVRNRMLTSQPYEKRHYDLVAAYNSAWSLAPKTEI